ncbi:MAG: hypothetical protein SNJ71_00820 [Bacteroidales bacterium]
MAKNLGTLTVWLTADSKKLVSGLASAKNALMKWSSAAVTAGAAGAAALSAFSISSIKTFMEAEQATIDLTAALKNAGDATAYTIPSLQKFASEVQKQTIYEDDAIISAMAYGSNLGIQTSRLKEATTAAIGLAAAYRMDLKSAMMLIGRASQGQTSLLTRYGIILDETLSPQEKFNQLLKIGASNFDVAKDQAGSLSGKMEQLKNIWGDLKETFGELIVNILNLSDILEKGKGGLQWWVDELKNNLPAIAFMIKSVFLEVKFALIQTGVFIKNLSTPIFSVFVVAQKNIQNIFSWIWENLEKLFTNLPKVFTAAIKDIWQMFSGVDFWGDLLSGKSFEEAFSYHLSNVGKNLEKVMAEAGVSELKIEEPDFSAWGKIFEDVSRIDEERAKAIEDLFKQTMEKVGAAPLSPGENKKDLLSEANKQIITPKKSRLSQETSVTGAILKGSAEALRIENTRVTKEDKIEKNTGKTAKNSDKAVQLLQKISDNIGKFELEEAI